MSDELVEGLVVAAQVDMKQYREAAYDNIKGEVKVLGTILELTDGKAVRATGLSLLERLTEPILTDVAVEIVRAIIKRYPTSSSVTVTRSWLDQLDLDRGRLEDKTGLDRQGIDRVLKAMFDKLQTSKNVAELDGVEVKLLPAPKETLAPGNQPVANAARRARNETGENGRAEAERRSSGGKSDTAPPSSCTLGNRRRN